MCRLTLETVIKCDLLHYLLIRWVSERVGPIGLEQMVRYTIERIVVQAWGKAVSGFPRPRLVNGRDWSYKPNAT